MNSNFWQPRYWVAIGAGVIVSILLSALLINEDVSLISSRPPEERVLISSGTIKRDQVLATLLYDNKIDPRSVPKIQHSLGEKINLRRDITVGKRYEIVTSTMGVFKRFVYHKTPTLSYVVHRSSMGVYKCVKTKEKTVWLETRVSCTVEDNLYLTLKNMGYKERFVGNVVSDLMDQIFAWRIDFFSEQRNGDKLDLLMEQEYKIGSDNPIPGSGRILAAYYEGQGTRYKENYAFRYDGANGNKKVEFFDENGKAVRKVFRRVPFKHESYRISSRFNPNRRHPILRIVRPHHGIDYAAPRGTPVVAIGNGRVTLAGWKGNYGKTVEIRHDNRYTSRYGHLSSITVKRGQYVDQGNRIGRVGTTGLSTGPHLHFEMIKDGSRQDFLRMHLPSGKPVSPDNMADFERVRDGFLVRLKNSDNQAVAMTSPTRSLRNN